MGSWTWREVDVGPSGRAVRDVDLDLLDAENVGSNPALGKDVCPSLFIIIHFSYRSLVTVKTS
jgi:hypothetical protein